MKKTLLVYIISLSCILTSCSNVKKTYNLREIDLDLVVKNDLKNHVNVLLQNFDAYESCEERENCSFEGKTLFDAKTFKRVDLMSAETNFNETITEVFNIQADLDESNFAYNFDYLDSVNILIESYSGNVSPSYDSFFDDYFIEFGGNNFYFKDALQSFEECGVSCRLIDRTTEYGGSGFIILVGIIAIGAAVVSMPENTLVSDFLYWWESFLTWLTNLGRDVDGASTTTNIDYRYQTEINGYVYQMDRIKETPMREQGKYYVAVADYDDGYVYMCNIALPIDNDNSAAKSVIILGLQGDPGSKIVSVTNPDHLFLLSLYTVNGLDAEYVTKKANGYVTGNYCSYFDSVHDGPDHNKTGIYFEHYHPGVKTNSDVRTPHCFYGTAITHGI